jgi:hypothetical protein
VQRDDSNAGFGAGDAGVPAVGALRLITLHTSDDVARRRTTRRRISKQVGLERRRGDRRHAKPGIDGLLHTVLTGE